MTDSSSGSGRNPVEALADEFLQRQRAAASDRHSRNTAGVTPSWPTRSARSSRS